MAEIIINPAGATVPVDVVCGNAKAEKIRFVFDRYEDGVDLSELAWAVTVINSAGMSDVYMEGSGVTDVEVFDDTVSVLWELYGTATATAGRTVYQLGGLIGRAVIKRFPSHTLNVQSYVQSTLSNDAEEDLSVLWQTIDYVGNELPTILAAEQQRQADFAKLDLRVEKILRTTRVTATNTRGETTVASVLDGENFAIRAMYPTLEDLLLQHQTGYLGDVYAVGNDADIKEIYFWDVDKKSWQLYGTLAIEMPESIIIDDEVTADGAYPVSGAAIHTFVTGYVPDTVPAGNVTTGTFPGMVVANATATAALEEVQMRNSVIVSADPGEGTEVSYPAGTLVIYA